MVQNNKKLELKKTDAEWPGHVASVFGLQLSSPQNSKVRPVYNVLLNIDVSLP